MHPQNAMLETSPDLCSARPRPGEPSATFGCTEATTPAWPCFHVHSINSSVGPSPDETTTATWRYQRNQQFSITAVTTSSGSVAERYAYAAHGQPTILDGSGSVLSSSAINNRYTYTGREWDATLGLYHFRARWVSGLAGRFMGRDPIGYDGIQFELVSYCDLNPFRFVDPSGKTITVIGGLTIVGCFGYGACKIWDANDGSSKGRRPMTLPEAKCINDANRAAPKEAGVHCGGEVRMADKISGPITVCHSTCSTVIGKPIYIGGGDVDCKTCTGFLNTMMTLMHECVHTKQSCLGELSCKEKEAYSTATSSMMRNADLICANSVVQGKCGSMSQCLEALVQVVSVDLQVLAEQSAECNAATSQASVN